MYSLLASAGIDIPRHAILLRDQNGEPINTNFVEYDDSVQIGDVVFQKPFVEKPVNAEDHNVYIYYPSHAGGGSQRLFRKVGNRSSVYSAESSVRKEGSYIYEDFVVTDGTDVKVCIPCKETLFVMKICSIINQSKNITGFVQVMEILENSRNFRILKSRPGDPGKSG